MLEVDIPRKRIALTMRLDDEASRDKPHHPKEQHEPQRKPAHRHTHDKKPADSGNNAFAAAFANAKRK